MIKGDACERFKVAHACRKGIRSVRVSPAQPRHAFIGAGGYLWVVDFETARTEGTLTGLGKPTKVS